MEKMVMSAKDCAADAASLHDLGTHFVHDEKNTTPSNTDLEAPNSAAFEAPTTHNRSLSPNALHAGLLQRQGSRHVRLLSTPPVLDHGSRRILCAAPRPSFPPPGYPHPTTKQTELDAVLADIIRVPGIVTWET